MAVMRKCGVNNTLQPGDIAGKTSHSDAVLEAPEQTDQLGANRRLGAGMPGHKSVG